VTGYQVYNCPKCDGPLDMLAELVGACHPCETLVEIHLLAPFIPDSDHGDGTVAAG
jgi:hypothetical protein